MSLRFLSIALCAVLAVCQPVALHAAVTFAVVPSEISLKGNFAQTQLLTHSFPQGSLRCDVNVSVNRIGESWGTRCEIKNLNSVKFMMIAIG